jgi:hypothetical protein
MSHVVENIEDYEDNLSHVTLLVSETAGGSRATLNVSLL